MKKSIDIVNLAKNSLITLKSLRSDYMDNLNFNYQPFESSDPLNIEDEKIRRIKESLDKVELGVNEAELILMLSDYFDIVEANTMKLNAMILRLSEENSWLRDEITSTQNRLNMTEEQNIDLENQIKEYELKLDLKRFDQPLPNSYSSNQLSESVNLSESSFSGQITDGVDADGDYSQSKSGKSLKEQNVKADEECPSKNYNYELPEHLKTLHSLVTDYSTQGRYEVAIALCKQAIQNEMKNILSKRKFLSDDQESNETIEAECSSLDIATLQNIFALVYRDQGNYMESVNLLNKSLCIREKLLGSNHPLIAITLNNIAILQAKVGKLREAESMCRRALNIREQHLGGNHPDVAKQLFNLALLVQNQGRYEEVEQIYKKALSIYADNFGPDNINVIKTRNNIAYVHLKQNNFVQAEIIFKELLTCWHERLTNFGNDKPNLVFPKKPLWVIVEDKSLFGIGQNLKNLAEIQKILPLYSMTADLPKEEFDLFSSTISYLIRAYKGQGKLTEADIIEDWLSRSIKQNSKGPIVTDDSPESYSRYSIKRISSKISSKLRFFRTNATCGQDDNELLNSTKSVNFQNSKDSVQK